MGRAEGFGGGPAKLCIPLGANGRMKRGVRLLDRGESILIDSLEGRHRPSR